MRPDIPWNVAGIPPEAREAARAAARREGLSVGEWMTRRILRSFSDNSDDSAPVRDTWNANGANYVTAPEPRPASRRDTEDMLAHVARSESETGEVFRRIEEQLRGVARRLEAAERSQSENNRAMSKAASEINVAAREQAQAFDQLGSSVVGLADRIDRVERMSAHDGLKDAVKGLHQGLSRLADQISATANQSATQISALADNLESVAGRAGQARTDAEAATRAFEQRIAQIDDRVRSVERLAQASQDTIQHALQSIEARRDDDAAAMRRDAETAIARLEDNIARLQSRPEPGAAARDPEMASAIARLEESFARLDARSADPAIDRRLSSIERSLSDIASRFDKPDPASAAVADDLKRLSQRIEAAEARQHESVSELRAAMNQASGRIAAVETVPHTVTGGGQTMPFPPPPAAAFDAPPFPDAGAPDNAPPFQASADPFAAVAEPASPTFHPEAPFGEEPTFTNPSIADEPMNPPAHETGSEPAPASIVDTYLSAARRSARAAAAQAEAERGMRAGGFSWGTMSSSLSSEDKPSARKTYIWIAIIALLAIVAIGAGVILSQRISSSSPHPVGSLFSKSRTAEPPATRPAANLLPTPADEPAAPPTGGDTAAPSPEMSTVVVPVGSNGAEDHPTAPNNSTAAPPPATHNIPAATNSVPPKTPAAAPAPVAHPASGAANVPAPASHPATTTIQPAVHSTAALSPLDKLTALANGGNAKAELVVGLKYLDGDGVAVNEADAVKWLERAAVQGLPVAQYRLGTMFERGRGVTADAAKAVHWYSLSAQAGNRKAMHNLAVAYASGTGIAKNLAEAARWFSKAASLGLSDSQFNLAVLYERGLGVPQSLLDAYKWYAIAAAAGDTESKTRKDALATQLSTDDRAAAQHSADAFHAQPLDAKANVAPLMSDVTG